MDCYHPRRKDARIRPFPKTIATPRISKPVNYWDRSRWWGEVCPIRIRRVNARKLFIESLLCSNESILWGWELLCIADLILNQALLVTSIHTCYSYLKESRLIGLFAFDFASKSKIPNLKLITRMGYVFQRRSSTRAGSDVLGDDKNRRGASRRRLDVIKANTFL